MTKFITFYSFTGNENTTAAILQMAGNLQEKGLRVLLLDMNLQAPTLSFHLSVKQPGIVELFSDAKELGIEADLFALPADRVMLKYSLPYHFKTLDNEVMYHFLSVGNLSENYIDRLDALRLREMYQEGVGEPLIRVLKKVITDSNMFDCVLINSGTGYSDEMGVCTRDLSDLVLFFVGPTHRDATLSLVQLFRENKITFKMVFRNSGDHLICKSDSEDRCKYWPNYWLSKSTSHYLPIEIKPELIINDQPQAEFDKVFTGALLESSQLYADYYFLSEGIEQLIKAK